MSDTKHTPGPMTWRHRGGSEEWKVKDANGLLFATVYSLEDAETFISLCNSHDALLAAAVEMEAASAS